MYMIQAIKLIEKNPEKYFLFNIDGKLMLYTKKEDDGLDLKKNVVYYIDKNDN